MPDPSPSTLTVKTPTSYSSEEGVVAGHSRQFTPGGYLSTVQHTALAGIEPTTFRLVVRRATSRLPRPLLLHYPLIFLKRRCQGMRPPKFVRSLGGDMHSRECVLVPIHASGFLKHRTAGLHVRLE